MTNHNNEHLDEKQITVLKFAQLLQVGLLQNDHDILDYSFTMAREHFTDAELVVELGRVLAADVLNMHGGNREATINSIQKTLLDLSE